ncbi:hypothetical protein O3M35_012994 [Rhynocoris fuscipes]|uniref:SEA domain-containing protein n=1 Tax=Rhynocoris fuscipes TaxID=488301 RepID=A0AAW1CFF3_9HEMI
MSHEVTLTDDQTQDSHNHSTTIEITGNGQVNAAFEDTETNCRTSRTGDVPNGNSSNNTMAGSETVETPTTPLAGGGGGGGGGNRELNHHMNGSAPADNSNNKVNGVGDAKTPTSNDVKDVAEAVNLELVNMQPFNNGIPVKKESTELDIGDPYDEYFVPVNQHKKYMRGEKLYVTQDKRRSLGGGKRKCCWGLLSVIVLGIIVAILIGVLLSQDSNSPVESRTFNSDVKGAGLAGSLSTPRPKSTQQPTRTTTADTSEKYLQRVIEGELTIDNMEFTPDLANQNSSEFITLATSLEEELKRALFDRQMLLYGSSDITVKVLEFKSGSVVVIYRVGWQFKPGIHGSPDPLTKETMKTRLQEHLRNNDGFLYNYRMPISSLKSTKIMDNCEMNNNNCSHTCTFNFTILQFKCSCPPDYILDSDGKTCIEHSEEDSEHQHHLDSEEPFMPFPSPDYDQEHHHSSENYPSEEHIPVTEQYPNSEEEHYPQHIHPEEPSSSTEHHPDEIPEEPIPTTGRDELSEPSHHDQDMYPDWNDERDQWHDTNPWYVPPQEPEQHPTEHEMKSSTESNVPDVPHTELNPVSKDTVSPSSKEVHAVESVPVMTESPAESDGMVSESDINNLSSEIEYEQHPDMVTENIPMTEAPVTMKKEDLSHDIEHVEHKEVSEEPKPLSELMSPVEVQNNEDEMVKQAEEPSNDTEQETQVISGDVPVTALPKQSAEGTSEPNETMNQTEHGAGSMRSLNLGLIVPLTENQSNNTDDIQNSTQPIIASVEPEMIMTTEMPLNNLDSSSTSSVTSVEPESVDVSPSMDYANEQNGTTEHKVSTENMHPVEEISSTEHGQMSSEVSHQEEIGNTHDSMVITEPIATTMPSITMVPETMSSTTEVNHPEMMSSPEEKITTLAVDNNTEKGMTKEFEYGMTHPAEDMNVNNTMPMATVTEHFAHTELPATTIIPEIHGELNSTAMDHQPVDEIMMENATEMNKKNLENSESNGRSMNENIGITAEPEIAPETGETVSPEQTTVVNTNSSQLNEEPKVDIIGETKMDNTTEYENKMMTTADHNETENSAENHLETTTVNVKLETKVPSTVITTMPPEVPEEMKPTEKIMPIVELHQSIEKTTEIASKQAEITELPMSTAMDKETMSPKTDDNKDKAEMTTMMPLVHPAVGEEAENATETILGVQHFGSISEDNTTQSDNIPMQTNPNMAQTISDFEMTTNHDLIKDSIKNITDDVVTENSHLEMSSSTTEKMNNTVPDNSTLEMMGHAEIRNETMAEVNGTTVAEEVVEMTTMPIFKIETNASNVEEVNVEHSTEGIVQMLSTTETKIEAEAMPTPYIHPALEHMIPLTHIPDLAGPFSVDTIIEHPITYPEDDKSDEPTVVHQHQDDHQTDITADTLNSLDDDYAEVDKKKYYKPTKTKNLKNFKIQEVNVPIDSLADETSKDVQHSKEQPVSNQDVVTTMMPPASIVRDELTSNDAYTTKSPLFKDETPIKNSIVPAELPSKPKNDQLNNLFFSNEAETTISPIFDNTLNNTAIIKNKINESDLIENKTESTNHFVDNLNQLEAKVESDTVTENIPLNNDNSSANSSATTKLDDTLTVTEQPINLTNNESEQVEGTSMKIETSSVTANEMESTSPKLYNTSALVELLTPSKKCASGQFSCADGSGCIKTIQRCDAVRDCVDGSDEMNCEEQGCLENFQCKNRQCLKRSLVCDSMPNCSDGSDESDCENWKCNFDEVRCQTSGQCIPVLWKCDGKSDCRDNSDEWRCTDSCPNNEFWCPEGRCIPHNSTCNGVNDCLKGEDELHCTTTL